MQAHPFQVDGQTRAFAVLGHPVSHTLSPVMHNAALRALHMNALYMAFDVHPDHLMTALRGMARMGFGGVNLTIPHKEIAYRHVDQHAESALLTGSVNTIAFEQDGTLTGHSTDGYGLRQALSEAFARTFTDADVLVLGCGGAGRAAALEAALHGAARVRLANRTPARISALLPELRAAAPNTDFLPCAAWPPSPEDTQPATLMLNATAVGMNADDTPPLTPAHLHPGQALLDMTYVLPETPLMRIANAAGAQAANGLGMLLHQGARSFEIWTGTPPPLNPMRNALRQAMYGDTEHV